MKTVSLALVIVPIVSLTFLAATHAADSSLHNAQTRILFAPDDDCTGGIIKEINKARSCILVQAFSFTSDEIVTALVAAHKRGARVEIILDKSNRTAKNSVGEHAARMGILTYIDAGHAIANNKVMIIDGETLITGSFNFTKAAEARNAENLLIIKNKRLAATYRKNWEKHKAHSEKYPTMQ